MANKRKELAKIQGQVQHYRGVVSDIEAKLVKHQGMVEDSESQSQALQQDIESIRAEVSSPAVELPRPPFGNPPEGEPPQEQERDDKMEDGDENPDELGTDPDDDGRDAFAPVRKKVRKSLVVKNTSAEAYSTLLGFVVKWANSA